MSYGKPASQLEVRFWQAVEVALSLFVIGTTISGLAIFLALVRW